MNNLLAWRCVIGMTLAVAASGAAPLGNNPAAGHYVPVHGIRLYVEEYGSGAPLLMLHGNGGSMAAFSHNVDYFAAKYHVILVDSRAQGKSRDDAAALSFEMMADDFAALLDTLKVPRAFVIGWSDGGIDALLLAIRHPEKVAALAASGANLWPGADAFGDAEWARMAGQDRQGLPANATPQQRNRWKLFLLDYEQPRISLEQLHGISCPSLIIGGDHDAILVPHTVTIFQNIPQAELWILPNSGHATLRAHADDFNRTVDDFFRRTRLRP